MPNVRVEMEPANFTAKGHDSSVKPTVTKVRKKKTAEGWVTPYADPKKVAHQKEMELKKQKAAAKRGAYKDATPAQRAEAKALCVECSNLNTEIRAEAEERHAKAKVVELEKQAAAKKREEARQKYTEKKTEE